MVHAQVRESVDFYEDPRFTPALHRSNLRGFLVRNRSANIQPVKLTFAG